MTGRSSYKQTIDVLLAINEGKTSSEIKSSIQLSRYSYDYILNRLRNYQLLEDHGDALVISKKGANVINFLMENKKVSQDRSVYFAALR